MTTLIELAEFARAAYGDPIPNPENWVKIDEAIPVNTVDSYAQAYLNEKTKEIIIAYRGTRPTSLNDLLNDGSLTLHISTTSQALAANYAKAISALYPDYKIINTGHSLGGNLAQAATAALQDSGVPNVSAVLFNGPGIGGYAHKSPVSAYDVLNVVAQGDLIHLAGGEHLGGQQLMLSAGPSLASELSSLPLGFLGPVGNLVGVGKFLGNVVGEAHSINTIISYMANINPGIGFEHWPALGGDIGDTALPNPSTVVGNSLDVSTKLGDLIDLHLQGTGTESSISGVYDLSGTADNGNSVSISNDSQNKFAYSRSPTSASLSGDTVKLSGGPLSGASLSISGESGTLKASISKAGFVDVSYVGAESSESETYDNVTKKFTHDVARSDGSGFSVIESGDGSVVRKDWTSTSTQESTYASDGSIDVIKHSDNGDSYTFHRNSDGSATAVQISYYEGNMISKTITETSDGHLTAVFSSPSGSTTIDNASPAGFFWPTEYHEATTDESLSPNEVNGIVQIRTPWGNTCINRNADQFQISTNNGPLIGAPSIYVFGGAVNITDNDASYKFLNGILLHYTSNDVEVDAGNNGQLISASSNGYSLTNQTGVYGEAEIFADGTPATKVTYSPGIYDEYWTKNGTNYVKSVGITTITATQSVPGINGYHQVITDKAGKPEAEFIVNADGTTRHVAYIYETDNSYTINTTDFSGSATTATLSEKYDSSGRLSLTDITNSSEHKVTKYSYINGLLSEVVESTTRTNNSTSETHFDSTGNKTIEMWSDGHGGNGTITYHADGTHSEIKTDSSANSYGSEFNKSGNLTSENDVFSDGSTHSINNIYNDTGNLLTSTETGHGKTTVTTYSTDGTSSGKSTYNDGSYAIFEDSPQSHHLSMYTSGGKLIQEEISNNIGNDIKYYDDAGFVVYETKADQNGSLAKSFNADRSEYFEEYHGSSGSYFNEYLANGTLLHSQGNDNVGGTWDTTYDSSGHEVSSNWSKAGVITGGTRHNSDGSIFKFQSSVDGSASASFASNSNDKAQVLMGSYGNDNLTIDGTANFAAGSYGDDVIELAQGKNVIAYNIGDGRDILKLTTGQPGTLSLGGGITSDMIDLSKSGQDLIVEFWGESQAVVLENWYQDISKQSVSTLQLIKGNPDVTSTDPLRAYMVNDFDFSALVKAFDLARVSDPTITTWSASTSLMSTLLFSSNSKAYGGIFATDYANSHTLHVDVVGVPALLASPEFGVGLQDLVA